MNNIIKLSSKIQFDMDSLRPYSTKENTPFEPLKRRTLSTLSLRYTLINARISTIDPLIFFKLGPLLILPM